MHTKRWVSAASATALLTAGLLAGTASSASAAPDNCSVSYTMGGRSASSLCTSGTGEHRVKVLQKHFDPTAGPILIEGPWQPVGTVSYANLTPHTIVNVWVEKRG